MADDPQDTPAQPTPPGATGSRPKMRRPNRLRGPDAPAPAAPKNKTFVPKLIGEILTQTERDNLPEEAQAFLVQGYNYALEEYGDPARALHLGWAAVQRHFHKVGQHWEPLPEHAQSAPPAAAPKPSDADIAERLKHLHHR